MQYVKYTVTLRPSNGNPWLDWNLLNKEISREKAGAQQTTRWFLSHSSNNIPDRQLNAEEVLEYLEEVFGYEASVHRYSDPGVDPAPADTNVPGAL